MDEVERIWMGGKAILGPMVRASSLPLRLAALEYDADIVYSEEIPAHRAGHSSCVRHENPVLGTIDFIEKKSSPCDTLVLFRTDIDKEVRPRKCVLQLGCSDSTTALKAARMFERDVAAIDINMGCSKHYSTSRGMGSALMSKPEVAEDIIKTLRRNISVPISVKTRVHSTSCGSQGACSEGSAAGSGEVDVARSIEWLQRLQISGAQAITVHMRTPTEKYRDAAHIDLFGVLHQKMRCSHTPLVYNGDIWTSADIKRVQRSVHAAVKNSALEGETERTARTACAIDGVSVMVSRAGLWNPSVFRELLRGEQKTAADNHPAECDKEEFRPPQEGCNTKSAEIVELLTCIMKHSANSANCPLNTRYLLQQILAGAKRLHSDTRSEIVRFYDLEGVSEGLGCAVGVKAEKDRQASAWRDNLESSAASTAEEAPESGVGRAEVTIEAADLFAHNYGTSGTADTPESVTQVLPCASAALILAPLPSQTALRQFFNSTTWPGVVSKTSHEYNDRYFDDNYYVAFNKPQSVVQTLLVESAGQASGGVKRGFVFSGYSDACTTIARVKKKIS